MEPPPAHAHVLDGSRRGTKRRLTRRPSTAFQRTRAVTDAAVCGLLMTNVGADAAALRKGVGMRVTEHAYVTGIGAASVQNIPQSQRSRHPNQVGSHCGLSAGHTGEKQWMPWPCQMVDS